MIDPLAVVACYRGIALNDTRLLQGLKGIAVFIVLARHLSYAPLAIPREQDIQAGKNVF